MSLNRSLAADLALARDCIRDARLLLPIGSRNAAYLASQAAEHLVRLVARTEGLHIERKDAHQLDTTIRRLPDDNADKSALAEIAFLEAYATAYRYPTPSGRQPIAPKATLLKDALDGLAALLDRLEAHHAVDAASGQARLTSPRRP